MKRQEKSRFFWYRLLVVVGIGSVYLSNQVYTIYGGDAGELVSAIVTRGIPHPPGYPLYTLLGIIADKFILVGTSAWRVGFLSSIASILTLLVLFDLLLTLTKKAAVSFLSVMVLAFTYPFWLYSEVVEVFALNNLFIVLLLWSFFHFYKEGQKKFLYLGFFILGLSLTHHHIILFLVPCLLFLLFQQRKLFTRRKIIISVVLFLLGLLPYLYVFISSGQNPEINWMGKPSINNFIALITRSTYGTFKAGAFIANQLNLRLLDIYGFWNFAYQDFRLIGVFLFILGAFYLFLMRKTLFYAFSIGFASYLFFLFYASFPLTENFIVGTFERFVLPLYIFTAIFIDFGLLGLVSVLEKILNKFLNAQKNRLISNLMIGIFLIYPMGLLFLNTPKISILKNDFTAEYFAEDLLNSVPDNSIILVSLDTALFDSQYVYYTQKKWRDIKLIHFSKLLDPKMSYQFDKYYSGIYLGQRTGSIKDQFQSFIEKNYGKFPIFSKQAYAQEDGSWVPWGLLFRFYKNKDVPEDKYILMENRKIWSLYHDPLAGSLSRFQNLLLADTIRMYTLANQEIGFWAAKRGFNDDAQKHLLIAEKLSPNDLDSYNILAQVYIQQNKCDKAEEQINYRIKKDREDSQNYLLLSINYAVCRHDEAKASFYKNLYEEKSKKKETLLKKV